MFSLKYLAVKLVDLLFPTVCAACGKPGPMICDACLAKMPRLGHSGCLRCGRPLTNAASKCTFCQTSEFNLKQARACFTYSEPLISIIHRLKYDGLFALARPLGQHMARNWPNWAQEPDIIIPIPLHNRRRRIRGFNQSTLLAKQLSPSTGIAINELVLKRVRNTPPQVGLSPIERKQNVWGAFAADPASVRGRQVLLVDDVLTTGATMSSAAATLLEAGASSVSAYCLAQAV